ncbi:MAG: hypothetical protein U0527_09920 [Candidatus Eisenbacteria bacterium]
MLSNPFDRRFRTITLSLLAACAASALAAGIVGISDNPPGIALAFLAAGAFVAAFVHPWRSVRPFAVLLGITVGSFVVLVLVHNFGEALATLARTPTLLRVPLNGVSVVAFLLAVLICPPTLVVSLLGLLIMSVRKLALRGH